MVNGALIYLGSIAHIALVDLAVIALHTTYKKLQLVINQGNYKS